MKILGIGESVIDKIRVIQGDTKDRQFSCALESEHIGGSVLSALVLLARLNLNCTFLTSIAEDNESKIIKQKLDEEGIKIIANSVKKTKVNTILVNAKNGQREKLRGTIKHSPIKNIPTDFVQQFDLIIVDRHEKEAFYEVIGKKKPSTKILIDPSTELSDFTLDMIKYSDYPILPIELLVKVGKNKELAFCLEFFYKICQKPIIITAGELGSLVYDGKRLELILALKIKAVDTTGAGDIYRGAFAYGVTQGLSLKECAKFANTVAALQCIKLGNVSAIPTKEEIKLFTELSIQKRLISFSNVNNYFLELHQSLWK